MFVRNLDVKRLRFKMWCDFLFVFAWNASVFSGLRSLFYLLSIRIHWISRFLWFINRNVINKPVQFGDFSTCFKIYRECRWKGAIRWIQDIALPLNKVFEQRHWSFNCRIYFLRTNFFDNLDSYPFLVSYSISAPAKTQ